MKQLRTPSNPKLWKFKTSHQTFSTIPRQSVCLVTWRRDWRSHGLTKGSFSYPAKSKSITGHFYTTRQINMGLLFQLTGLTRLNLNTTAYIETEKNPKDIICSLCGSTCFAYCWDEQSFNISLTSQMQISPSMFHHHMETSRKTRTCYFYRCKWFTVRTWYMTFPYF